jgi:hypothetical protein
MSVSAENTGWPLGTRRQSEFSGIIEVAPDRELALGQRLLEGGELPIRQKLTLTRSPPDVFHRTCKNLARIPIQRNLHGLIGLDELEVLLKIGPKQVGFAL